MKSKSLTVTAQPLPLAKPEAKPEAVAAALKAAFIQGDPARAAAFDRALLEGTARVAAASYLRILGQIE